MSEYPATLNGSLTEDLSSSACSVQFSWSDVNTGDWMQTCCQTPPVRWKSQQTKMGPRRQKSHDLGGMKHRSSAAAELHIQTEVFGKRLDFSLCEKQTNIKKNRDKHHSTPDET